jgi:signal transduction histidine kinase/ActR/RegA family two-component response regulator
MRAARVDRSLVALIAGFAILAVAVLATVALSATQPRSYAWINHTLKVENQVRTVMSRLVDAETGQRGYLITGREDYLDPYNVAAAKLDGDLATLRDLVADNPMQLANAERLRADAAERVILLRRTLDLYRRGDRDGAVAVVKAGRGKALMEDSRGVVRDMLAEEERLLVKRNQDVRTRAQAVGWGFVLAILVVLALGVFAVNDARLRLAASARVQAELEAINDQLKAEAASRASAESQVRQLQKMEAVGQLTGGIAHDFNNMLAIVIGSLDVAKRRLKSEPEKVEACLDNAMDGAQRASQLTGRLLAFSRQQPLAPRALDANKLVGGMSELLRRTVGENLKVETVLAGGLWTTFADPGQLENAVLNLCVNARDAMPDGGALTLETANAHLDDAYASQQVEVTAGQYVMVSVSDTGAGMPPEVAERAFDPFYTTKGVGRGTGLGLSQVHGFVKQSGGHVKIYSEPGVGTTVKLYLPRSRRQEDAIADVGPATAPRANGEEIVLVVEDEARVRHLSVDALRELGYVVVQAADASQALSVLELQPRVDLLFTDIVMPEMNGRRLADEAIARRPGLKVLYTTGYTRNAVVHNGVLDANVAFLPKPFTYDQLALKVRQVLDGAGANRTS